jgi:hypothetical protein
LYNMSTHRVTFEDLTAMTMKPTHPWMWRYAVW